MSLPLEVRGAAGAIYRTSFRTLRRLWPATGLVFVILLLHLLLDRAIQAQAPGATRWLWQHLAQGMMTVAVAPYVVNAYRCALGFEIRDLRSLLREPAPLLNLLAWLLAWGLVSALATWIWSHRGERLLPTPLLVVSCVGLWWIRTRLSLVGLVLAINELPVTLRAGVAATAGQVWSFSFIGLFLALPLVPFALAAMLAAYAASRTGSDPQAVTRILLTPLSLIGVVLGPTFEVEVYKRLGLPSEAASASLSEEP